MNNRQQIFYALSWDVLCIDAYSLYINDLKVVWEDSWQIPFQSNQGNLFVIFGEPDIDILDAMGPDGQPNQIQVKINGVDVFDPSTGEVRSDEWWLVCRRLSWPAGSACASAPPAAQCRACPCRTCDPPRRRGSRPSASRH